jgi:Tol biopolymer transport system component
MRSIILFSIILISTGNKVPQNLPTTVTTFRNSGLDVSWDQSGSDRIAYSSKGSDGYYDVHLANPDGSNDTCLTCNHPALPNKHICCPFWHPNGKWLLIVVEKASHPGTSTDALPGFGAYCDIWLISNNAQKAYKLIDLPNDANHGVIAPRFSPDGKHIVWTERTAAPNVFKPKQMAGFWTIKMADFAFGSNGIPVVSNTHIIQPGETAFYECYGFSPDGSKLIFCSDMNQPSFFNEHIYTVDTDGTHLVKLTEKDYNEHAIFTPDGNRIVWMTNTNSHTTGTDWWIMNADGSGKKQLTYFNEGHNEQSAGKAVWAGLGSFSTKGDRFVGGVQKSLITQEGKIVMVQLLP